jgi:hypothetical protein
MKSYSNERGITGMIQLASLSTDNNANFRNVDQQLNGSRDMIQKYHVF